MRPADGIEDILGILGGEVAIGDASGFDNSVEHMYKPREPVFGAVAHAMVAAGWSVFPQEVGGNRRPGTVDNEMIKWAEKHDLANRLPDPESLERWAAQCSSLNVAVVLGPASGHAFVLDVDVTEHELSAQIQSLADTILGPTPLRRVGRWPKIALVYRHAPDDEVPNRSPKFVVQDRGDSDQGLEIISSGKAMTFYGKHHVTGRYFTWLEGTPIDVGPGRVPLVTSAQVNDFLDAVDSVRPFRRNVSLDMTTVSYEWDENQKIHIPKIRAAGASDWTEDENGKIVDGREAYLSRLAFRIVTANRTAAHNDQALEQLVKITVHQFMQAAECTGRWQGASLEREARSKVRRAAAKLRSGEISEFVPPSDEQGRIVNAAVAKTFIPPQPREAGVDSLDFLPPQADVNAAGYDPAARGPRSGIKGEIVPAEPGAAKERALSPDRTEIAAAVGRGLEKAFSTFWDEVYDLSRDVSRIHVLRAPTGAGKTSRGISFIAGDPRTKEDYAVKGPDGQLLAEGRAPIVFLLPTYANIDELRSRATVLNLDGSLDDEGLGEQAREMGLVREDELEAKLADLRRDAMNAGLTTMVYKGKVHAGCRLAEMQKLALSAGIGSAGLCRAEILTDQKDEEGNRIVEEKFCQYYHNFDSRTDTAQNPLTVEDMCPAIRQRYDVAKSHVVFMPHAFLSLNVPEELKHVRAVVADERIHHLFLHTADFDLNVLWTPRRPPKLRKKEEEAGIEAAEFGQDRQRVAELAADALLLGKCPAEEIAKCSERTPDGMHAGLAWIEAAVRSCQASVEKGAKLVPGMSLEEMQDLCARPTGKGAREELRFWKIVQERVEKRIEEINNEQLAEADPALAVRRVTKGDRDYRIQLWQDLKESGEPVNRIRISWRSEPNWIDRPFLLMDASAAPEMIEKIWAGREVVTHDVKAPLNVRVVCVGDRTYSNASVIAGPSASKADMVSSVKMITSVRRTISVLSAMYGWSRVVAGASIKVRRAVNTGWECPPNVDWCHFGAMRGLDFAKYHEAAVSVGRMELPVRTIDGLVAALTYDDDDPEVPFDRNRMGIATGFAQDGKPLRMPMGVQRVMMRSGHDLSLPTPMFPGKWGRMIQKQYREEELLQFLGRLRPVYREGRAPIWFSLSTVMPEGVIVDDVVTSGELIGQHAAAWEAMRRCDGVLDPELAMVTCPDLFANEDRVRAVMQAAGMDLKRGTVKGRASWGVTAWKWRCSEGRDGCCFVRACEEAESLVPHVYRKLLGRDVVALERVGEAPSRSSALPRKADKIDVELGTGAERRETEEKQRVEAAIGLLMTATPESLEYLRRSSVPSLPVNVEVVSRDPVTGAGEPRWMTMDEAPAEAALKSLWKVMGMEAAPEEAKKPAPAVDASVVYEAAIVQALGRGTEIVYGDGKEKPGKDPLYVFDEDDRAIPM